MRYGGPDAAPVTTDGPLPETSDLVAGWYMIDVESHERAVELAAYVSSEPGPGGQPQSRNRLIRDAAGELPSARSMQPDWGLPGCPPRPFASRLTGPPARNCL